MTREEFAEAYAKRSGVTVEWLRAHGREAQPCDCGENSCEGWKMGMARVVITRSVLGFAFMQVCAVKDVTDEEILEVANVQNPSGTELGWVRVHRGEDKTLVQCLDDPGRLHFIVSC